MKRAENIVGQTAIDQQAVRAIVENIVNTMVFIRDADASDILAADKAQALAEKTARRAGLRHTNYGSGKRCTVAEGPLMRLLVPVGHSRQSTCHALRRQLQCSRSTNTQRTTMA